MGSSMVVVLLKLIDLGIAAAQNIPKAKSQYNELQGVMLEMVKENRTPSDSEWNELSRRLDKVSERIENA